MTTADSPAPMADRDWRAKHQAILAAAHGLFVSQGYAGTTMKELATLAGCSVGYLYKHFPGKQDILDALCAEHLDVLEDIRATCRRDPGVSALETVARELDLLCRHLAEHRALIPVYIQRQTETAPWLRERLDQIQREDVALYRAAVDRGELAEVDPELLAAAVDGAFWGLLKILATDADPAAVRRIPGFIDGLILQPLR
ncbi:MAG: TetR/AcrR family transcriptional regulator, partial [Candidatus Krumholzibacteriia bacterium]